MAVQIQIQALDAAIKAMANQGQKAHEGASRGKASGTGSLTKGKLVPVRQVGNVTLSIDVARRGGGDYEAIPFENNITISVASLRYPVKVLDGMKPEDLKAGQLYEGQPLKDTFRFGKAVAEMESDTKFVDGKPHALYIVPDIDLTVERVYVVPRFVEGDNQPIYDSQCQLRRAWFAE